MNKFTSHLSVFKKKLSIRVNVLYTCVFYILYITINFSTTSNSFASVIYPQRYSAESRFKSWSYRANGVYYYEGYYMNPAYIEFSSAEKINTIYTKKPKAWSFKPKNNRLFLTPISDDADTTMIVMTNKRVYFFELHTKTANGAFDPDVTFFVKFRYPAGIDDKKSSSSNGDENSIIRYSTTKGPDLTKAENFNFNYTVSGDYMITPIKVFDDGQFTYFEFRDKNGIIPGIFSVDNDGFESMVNFRIVNQYLAVEGVFSVFTLRHGAETVCVFNETMRGLTRNMMKKEK